MEPNPLPWVVTNAMWHPITVIIQAATVSEDIFVCPQGWFCRVRKAVESHSVASDAGGTMMIEVLNSGDNADAGVDQLTTALALNTTADTPQHGVTIDPPTLLSAGMRVGLVLGTNTNLVGSCVTVMLEVMQRTQQPL